MKEKTNRFVKIVIRTALVFLSIVFFPLGLFLLGYIIGSRKSIRKTVISRDNPSKMIERELIKELKEEVSDRVVL